MMSSYRSIRPVMRVAPLASVILYLQLAAIVWIAALEANATVAPPPFSCGLWSPPGRTSISIAADGTTYVDRNRVGPEALMRTLEQIHPYRDIDLWADPQANYGHVRELFNMFEEAGFRRIALQFYDLGPKPK